MLASAGIAVEPHARHFRHDALDVEWIPEVAARGWVALSRDKNIRKHPDEREAVLESGLRLLLLTGSVTSADHAKLFIDSFAVVERFVRKHEAPWIAGLYAPSERDRRMKQTPKGRVELLLSRA